MHFLVVAVVCALGAALPAEAYPRLVPALAIDRSVVFDAGAAVAAARTAANAFALPGDPFARRSAAVTARSPSVPALSRAELFALPDHYAWIERDTRAFWFATGVGAAATLATHVFVGLPTLVFGVGAIGAIGVGAPAGMLALGLGSVVAYFFAESALSSFASLLVFNGTSETYEGHYLTAFAAHFAGNLLSTTVTALTFGGGMLLLHGSALLAEFTAGGGVAALQLFSVLGAMPGVVVAGLALVIAPALLTSWALAVTASPKPGYAIDDDWRTPTALLPAIPTRDRAVAVVHPLVTIALPSP